MKFRPVGSSVSASRLSKSRVLLMLWIALTGAICAAQQMNLGPHDIGGRGCMACHVATTEPEGTAKYQWAGENRSLAMGSSAPQTDEGWSHSYRCLTCHDGNAAQIMDMGNMGRPMRPSAVGPHPVNVRYTPGDRSLFPTRLVGNEWRLVNNAENPSTNLKLFRRSALDPTPTVQCASCHDPHDHTNPFFLRDPYDRSFGGTRFCRTCHAEESQFAAVP
jgi:predicted CXXCH cytochrome family protein